MKICSWNVNGIRSASQKGFFEWIEKFQPDILCIQEVKAQPHEIPNLLLTSGKYNFYINHAQKKGYAGVAVYSKEKPLKVGNKIKLNRFDDEGRFLRLDFRDFILINIYVPNGGRGKTWMEYKLDFYDYFIKYLFKIKSKQVVVVGDFNVAHKEIDLARPKDNIKNTMFTPEERIKIDGLLSAGYVDTFRIFNNGNGNYSWWAYYRNLRERNIGWRIDYVFISKLLKSNIKRAFILPKVRGSDHCPVGIEIDI